MMKKYLLGLLGVFMFVSCSYDDSNTITKNDADIIEKKTIILEKFKSLGLDPDKVVFTDNMDKENVKVIKSLDELDAFLKPIEVNSSFESIDLNQKDIKDLDLSSNSKLKLNDSGYVQYGSVYESTKLMGISFVNMQYSFEFAPSLIRSKNPEGIRNFSTYITGFTLGISYSQQSTYLEEYMNYGGEIARIYAYGTINYSIFIEGIGTVYTAPVKTVIQFRMPSSRFSLAPSFLQAYSFILK